MSNIYLNGSSELDKSGSFSESKDLNSVINLTKEKLVRLLQERFTDVDSTQLVLENISQRIWTNGALGCQALGEIYTQALIPGYRLEFRVGDEHFVMHTDKNASRIVSPNFPENL